jgi:hypothetical protein
MSIYKKKENLAYMYPKFLQWLIGNPGISFFGPIEILASESFVL